MANERLDFEGLTYYHNKIKEELDLKLPKPTNSAPLTGDLLGVGRNGEPVWITRDTSYSFRGNATVAQINNSPWLCQKYYAYNITDSGTITNDASSPYPSFDVEAGDDIIGVEWKDGYGETHYAWQAFTAHDSNPIDDVEGEGIFARKQGEWVKVPTQEVIDKTFNTPRCMTLDTQYLVDTGGSFYIPLVAYEFPVPQTGAYTCSFTLELQCYMTCVRYNVVLQTGSFNTWGTFEGLVEEGSTVASAFKNALYMDFPSAGKCVVYLKTSDHVYDSGDLKVLSTLNHYSRVSRFVRYTTVADEVVDDDTVLITPADDYLPAASHIITRQIQLDEVVKTDDGSMPDPTYEGVRSQGYTGTRTEFYQALYNLLT
jgi:hypothetical protein